MDITKYFWKSTSDKLDGRALNISLQGSSSSSALSAARELTSVQEQQEQKISGKFCLKISKRN